MITPYQMYVLGVLDFERQQQADGLQGVGASVHIVPQKQVVNVGDVPSCGGSAVLLKKSHQVAKLTVKVAKQLDGSCKPQATSWSGASQRAEGTWGYSCVQGTQY